jgi:hypothetical protein
MGVIEADEAFPVWIMQRERIAQPVRTMLHRLDAPDREFQRIALFQPVNTAIEGQQEFECVFLIASHILSP